MNNFTQTQASITAYSKGGFKCTYTVLSTRVEELIELLIKQGYTSTPKAT